MGNLKRRGWTLVDRCFMCKDEEESIEHIVFHCPKARILWQLVFLLFGTAWMLSFSARSTLLSWNGCSVRKKQKNACKATPLCLF